MVRAAHQVRAQRMSSPTAGPSAPAHRVGAAGRGLPGATVRARIPSVHPVTGAGATDQRPWARDLRPAAPAVRQNCCGRSHVVGRRGAALGPAAEVDSRRVHAAAAAALFRDLGQKQPGARDAASKSYEYRPDQDVESRGHSEDQDYACRQQQQRRDRDRSNRRSVRRRRYRRSRRMCPRLPSESLRLPKQDHERTGSCREDTALTRCRAGSARPQLAIDHRVGCFERAGPAGQQIFLPWAEGRSVRNVAPHPGSCDRPERPRRPGWLSAGRPGRRRRRSWCR